jgi:hypothetical protein
MEGVHRHGHRKVKEKAMPIEFEIKPFVVAA